MLNSRIFNWFSEAGSADGLFLRKLPNLRWATGFKGADTAALITKDGGFILTDPRYTEQAAIECPDCTLVNWRAVGGTMMKALAAVIEEQKLESVAFEADAMTYGTYSELQGLTKAALIPTENVVERFRSIKSPEEIEYLRAACEIASRAFYRIIEDIRPGVTEKELAARLSCYMVLEGADTNPYGNILISGPNTSLLHGIPSDRAVQYGDFVLMDYGCQFNGYMSDMTRTVVVGKASAKQREVYDLCRRMTEDCEAAMKAGTCLNEVYERSLDAIRDTEYMQYNYSGIGHGIGLFVHEVPFIRPGVTEIYQENTVTTIEPGLYIPGWGGVRIEDQLLIGKDGNENMISVGHELVEL